MRTGKKIVVVHHQPLELFPPTLNFLQYLMRHAGGKHNLYALTTGTELKFKPFEGNGITIKRIYRQQKASNSLRRVVNFALFVITSVFYLARWRPEVIIYYESHSALPVYLYFRYFGGKSKLFIHYHEYMTSSEYNQKGMRFVAYSHKKEKYLYQRANWISHTNGKRVELFVADHPNVNPKVCKVLPNYPPKNWLTSMNSDAVSDSPLRLVYVGSFGSLEHLFIKELLTWVKAMNSQLTLDIYSYNVSPAVYEFFSSLESPNVQLKGSIDYGELPSILPKYDVGLIFYKATSLNVEHCAPNKLFEYLACGLDVWFSKEMTGCHPYMRDDVYPKVIKVDFNNLSGFDYKKAIGRNGLNEKRSDFFSEDVFAPLVKEMTND